MSVHEDGFRSGILAATLLFFGLFDLFQVVYTYTLRRGLFRGTQQHGVFFVFALFVFAVPGRRVLPPYFSGPWLSAGGVLPFPGLPFLDGKLRFFLGLAP